VGFLSPWFIGGLLAVGLPIYLHLLRRHSTTPKPFSSLMFFERRTQSSIKHRRLRYLLLLSLRLALLILLVLAFANPYIRRPASAASGDRLLLLVIDNSFSMRAGSRLADARDQAVSVLGSRPGAESAQVMALGAELQVLTQPIQDPGALRAAVESVQAGDSRTSYGELARELRSMADNVHTPIELHLFTDAQKTDMPGNFSELALPANVSLVLHTVVTSPVPNWTVESVNAPGQVWDPKKTHVQAVIAGYNTPAATRNVSLVVNGNAIATRSVAVPASGRATVEFDSLDVPYGFSRCEVKIDSADTLPADDTNLFAVQRADPGKILFVHEANDSRSPLYFGSALAASADAAFTVQSVTVEQAANQDPSKFAFVVLSDALVVPSSLESSLVRYVRGGGSVMVIEGTSGGHRPKVPVLGNSILDVRSYSGGGAGYLTVGETDPSHPSMDKAAQWAGVKFYYAVRVDPGDARVVAKLSDGTPLLLDEKMGEGRILLLTSGLDNLTNDFPLRAIFVPFVEQTAWYLSGTERRSGSRLVDSFLELRTAKEQAVSVEVVDPGGKRPLSLNEAASAQSFQLTQAGFYQLRLANGRQDLVGVNSDRRESDLSVIPNDVLSLWKGNTSTPAQAAAGGSSESQELAQSYSLWWYAMLLVFAAAIAESLLASRYLGTQTEET
jgi:Aerotolerance regulator N-terminal/von Willebrand factor type A domain